MEALPFELFIIVVDYSHHGTSNSRLPLVSQHFRQQWLRYAERQARFLNQEFSLGMQFRVANTHRNSWSRRYQAARRAAKRFLVFRRSLQDEFMPMSGKLDRLRRANALDSTVVVTKELELMHKVERLSYLKNLLVLDNQRLADECINACHAALRICARDANGEQNVPFDDEVARMAITVLEREVKILKTTCDCCEYKWHRRCRSNNKSDNDPAFVYYVIFLAQSQSSSENTNILCEATSKTLENISTGDFDPAYFFDHECLFKCYIALAKMNLTIYSADVDKSFHVLQTALGQARNLCPGFRLMLCRYVKSKADCYGEEKTWTFLICALLEFDTYPPLREKCTYRSREWNRIDEREIVQSTVDVKNLIRGMLDDLGVSQEQVDNVLEEAKNTMEED